MKWYTFLGISLFLMFAIIIVLNVGNKCENTLCQLQKLGYEQVCVKNFTTIVDVYKDLKYNHTHTIIYTNNTIGGFGISNGYLYSKNKYTECVEYQLIKKEQSLYMGEREVIVYKEDD